LSASETRRTSPSAVFEAAKKRLHRNVLAIALANKLARIAWSVLVHGRNFEVRKIDEAAAQSV
jgi:transposase